MEPTKIGIIGCGMISHRHMTVISNLKKRGQNLRVVAAAEIDAAKLKAWGEKYGMDENGKVYELSDSARYRLQGNSIARPFWTYLLRRIAAQYERPATLGSLFDGQAGFPLCWAEVGGIPVWSSEIEKHAQAVARYHFPEEDAT